MNGFADEEPIIEFPPLDPPNAPPSTIEIRAGELPRMATEGENAILQSQFPVFQRGGALVRPVKQTVTASKGRTTVAAGLQQINKHGMIDILAQAADWEVWNIRKKSLTPANPPDTVASIILSRSGLWRLPPIMGVTTTPTLRQDGSVLVAPGYDPETRLFHVADPNLTLTPAPLTKDTAKAAANLLLDLLAEFPFVSPVDQSVALSSLITPVVRGAMDVVPMHAFRASTAGTGKSYLTDLTAAITTGRPCPVISLGHNEEETEKRLTGMLLAGFPIIAIDNVNGILGGDLLCQAVERQLIRARPLGRSEIVEIESRATILANGNGLRVRGDMTRRSLIADLDANMERPETRLFTSNPLDKVSADRGIYVAAALNIVRCYMQAGLPGKLPALASFNAWSDLVRSAIVWLGLPDPCLSMEAAREDDPELGLLRDIMNHWENLIGLYTKIATRDAIKTAEAKNFDENGFNPTLRNEDFYDAVRRIAGEKGGINPNKFGNWLRSVEGRIVGARRFKKQQGTTGGVAMWALEKTG